MTIARSVRSSSGLITSWAAAAPSDLARSSERCRRAAARGARFLRSQQSPNGAIGHGTVVECYKAPLALLTTGHRDAAMHLLSWLQRSAQKEPGHFHRHDDALTLRRSATYRNAFILFGALLAGRFDIANETAIENFRSYQHLISGAFFGDHAKDSVSSEFNTNHTGLAGLVCLYSGLTDAARTAASYVLRHLEQQPHLERYFYINTDASGRLVTTFDSMSAFWRRIDYAIPRGHYWAIGTGAVLLCAVGARTGESNYIRGAEQLLALTGYLAPGFASWPSSGKLAWAAAELYCLTRDPKYRALATLIATRCFVETQGRDGSWGPFFLNMGKRRGYWLTKRELTAEFVFLAGRVAECTAQ